MSGFINKSNYMAAIDKTYVNKEEFLEAVKWAKEIGTVTLENGHRFRPLGFIRAYNNDLDNPELNYVEGTTEFVLWNTPMWFDRWLWLNCPLDFVKSTLKWQYSEDDLKKFENWTYHNPKDNLDFGKQHYTFLKIPKCRWCKYYMSHGHPKQKRKPLYYTIKMEAPNGEYEHDLEYDIQTDTWVDPEDYLPYSKTYTREYKWFNYHKNIPNRKSIIRELRRWYIPKGYIVKIYQINYEGLNFEILVK